jgi:branched-chain amino acid transport system ATP-binding protein
MILLQVSDISKSFGGLMALREVSLEVKKGDLLAIIGPNGAGKTTLFSTISGFYKPDNGSIHFKGRRIDGLKPHQISKMGLTRTFQIVQPFLEFTPYETLITAALNHLPMNQAKKKAREILGMVGLDDKADENSTRLTIPDQKALEMAKALATGAELILLDEVMAGLTRVEAEKIMSLIRRLNGEGISFLVVEHVMYVIMKLCPRILVLNFGSKIAEGPPEEIVNDKMVIDSYLGEEAEFA